MSISITDACKLDFANPKLERIGIIPIVRGETAETTFIGLACNRRAMITSIGGGIELGRDRNAGISLQREIEEELRSYLSLDWSAPNDWLAIVSGGSCTILPELDRIPEKEFIPTTEISAFLWVTRAEAQRLFNLQADRANYSKVYFGKFLSEIFPALLDVTNGLRETSREKCVLDFLTPFRDLPPSSNIRTTEEFFEILTNNPLHFHDRIIFYYSQEFEAFLFTDGEIMYQVFNTPKDLEFLGRFAESRKPRREIFYTMRDQVLMVPRGYFKVGILDDYHGNVDKTEELETYRTTMVTMKPKTARNKVLAMIKFERDLYEKKSEKRINPNDVKRIAFMKVYAQLLQERQGNGISPGNEVDFLLENGLV